MFLYIIPIYRYFICIKIQNNTTTIGSLKTIQDINDNSTMSSSSVVHSTSILRHNGDININFNFDFKHWFQVASSEYEYELVANHLENEHTVENLLFLTEYVQAKTLLKYKFDLLTQLIDNKTQTRFDVEIAKISQYFLIKQDNKIKQEHNQDNNLNYDRLSIQVSNTELPLSKSAIKLLS